MRIGRNNSVNLNKRITPSTVTPDLPRLQSRFAILRWHFRNVNRNSKITKKGGGAVRTIIGLLTRTHGINTSGKRPGKRHLRVNNKGTFVTTRLGNTVTMIRNFITRQKRRFSIYRNVGTGKVQLPTHGNGIIRLRVPRSLRRPINIILMLNFSVSRTRRRRTVNPTPSI